MANLTNRYNGESTVLVVSSYPDTKEGIKNLNAVAWYARKTFKEVAKKQRVNLVILAEVIDKPEIFNDGHILIIRCWKRNNPLLLRDLLYWIKKFPKAKTVLVEFEFNMFGGVITNCMLPVFLLGIKLANKRIVFELHQVILDLNSLNGHLNLKKNGLITKFFNFSLNFYYRLISFLSDRIIVLEEEFKKRLSNFTNPEKITVIPIAVPEKLSLPKQEARKKLKLSQKEFVVLYFGFINWYKGADWFAQEAQNINTGKQKIRFILAGGESPTLRKKSHYQKLYREVKRTERRNSNIQVTGFIEENKIPLYFSACDLVVLPYRVFMSSSGPLSWALQFRKPFILSQNLSKYFNSKDFKEALQKSGITKNEILFKLESQSFQNKIKLLSNKNKLEKLSLFSKELAQLRNAESLANLHLKELGYDTNIITIRRPILGQLRTGKLADRVGQSSS